MPTTQSFVCREKPTGSIDSANTTFTLANIPNPNTEQVFLNGVLQNASSNVETNDYVLAGAVITFTVPPQTGDVILVSYLLDIIDIVDDSTDSDGITSNLGRTELIHWCLRRLGAPVIEINVDDDQVEDRIDEALMYFRDYHFDGVERCYLKHRITASTLKLETDYTADVIRGVVLVGDESGATGTAYDKTVDNRTIRFKSTNGVAFKEGETVTVSGQTEKAKVLTATFGDVDNKYVTLNQKVISVTNVIPQQSSTIGGNLGGMFDFQYQFALHNMFNLASTDLVTYDIYKRYISTWEFMFRGTKGIRFNRKTDKVFLDLQDWTVDQYVIFEAWVALDPSTYKEIYMDEFVREYACALVKLQWGTNMKKFSGIGLPGGVTLNGQQLYDEAKAELDVLKERIKKEFQLPPDFIVG
jgi:hypothetical protein